MRATRAAPTPFVGRERELAALEEMLQQTSCGHGRVAVVSGEPGIGKTRLLMELATVAGPSRRVLVGHAYESEGMPPYVPFLEALDGQWPRDESGGPTGLLAERVAELALLFPKLRGSCAGSWPVAPLDPQGSRYRLFEAIWALMSAIALDHPDGLLLILEDLHWADDSSLSLLEHLALRVAAAPVLVVATIRDGESDVNVRLARMLEQIARQSASRRFGLKRLGRDQVGQVLAILGKPHPPPSLVDAVAEATDGNPFFVHEVFRSLAGEHRLFTEDGLWRTELMPDAPTVPQTVRVVIDRRLNRLAAGTRGVLATAAVIGRGFDYELLQAVTELDEESLLRAIEEAQLFGLVETDNSGGLRFSHELLRQTLLAGQAVARRQGLHSRIAEAAERIYAHDLEPHVAEIALHYRLADRRADWSRAIESAIRAGDRATAVLAFEEALGFYDMALEVLRRSRGDDAALMANLRLKRGETLISLGRWHDARPELLAAGEGLTGAGQAEILIRLAQANLLQFFDIPSVRIYAKEAEALAVRIERADLVAGARGVLAQAAFLDGDLRGSLELYAASYSPEHLRSDLLRQSFANLPIVHYLLGQFEQSALYAREAVAASRSANDSYSLVAQLSHLGLSLSASGHYDEGLMAFAESRRAADECPVPNVRQNLARAISMSAGVHLEAFDLEGAECLSEEARALARSSNFPPAVTSEALTLLFIHARSHRPERAQKLICEVEAALPAATGAHYYQWRVRFFVAQAELALARDAYDLAIQHAGEALDLNRVLGRPKYEVLARRARGLAQAGLGRKLQALTDLRRAVAIARTVNSPALLLGAAAAVLAVEGDGGLAADARLAADRIEATLPTDEMRRAFADSEQVRLVHGMQPSILRRVRRRTCGPDGLTTREAEILRLVAAGSSSREVGESLVLSVRTVERHIANAYLKTGTHNRAQLTAYALAHGLTGD